MQDWNRYRDALVAHVGEFAELSPEVTRGLYTIEMSASKSGHLEPKIHELIARAVAVTTRCDDYIEVHAQKVMDLGATREEIAKALGTAIALNAGAALTYTASVFDSIDAMAKA